VRTLNKQRPPGDPTKYEEMRRAVRDLQHAHSFFQHLHRLGPGTGLDSKKLGQHINFIAMTHDKSLVSCCLSGSPVGLAKQGYRGCQGCWGRCVAARPIAVAFQLCFAAAVKPPCGNQLSS